MRLTQTVRPLRRILFITGHTLRNIEWLSLWFYGSTYSYISNQRPSHKNYWKSDCYRYKSMSGEVYFQHIFFLSIKTKVK